MPSLKNGIIQYLSQQSYVLAHLLLAIFISETFYYLSRNAKI